LFLEQSRGKKKVKREVESTREGQMRAEGNVECYEGGEQIGNKTELLRTFLIRHY
jgi:acyl-CoA thioesterase